MDSKQQGWHSGVFMEIGCVLCHPLNSWTEQRNQEKPGKMHALKKPSLLITLSKKCRRALWHLRLLQISEADTLLVQGLM